QGIGGHLTADTAHDLLRRVGALTRTELNRRGADEAAVAGPVKDGRALEVGMVGEQRVIAAEDAGLYRDGLGVVPPPGVPMAFLDPVPDALDRLVLRHARTHGPFTSADVSTRLGVDAAASLARLAKS